LIAARALGSAGFVDAISALDHDVPHLLFDWRPAGAPGDLAADAARLSAAVFSPVEVAVCPHRAGPPSCWCRPPLPGLPLAFARTHDLDLSRSTVVGASPAHRTLANSVGASYVVVQ
jgi:hypothetical protein